MTPVQRKILTWISDTVSAKGYRPTIREMCTAFGWRSPNNAMEHMRRMRRDGLVDWREGLARTLTVTPLGVEQLRYSDQELEQEAGS